MDLKPNVPSLLRKREAIENLSRSTRHKLHVTHDMISRLGLEVELQGHSGCVNCLEWNSKGTILASASDDVQVMLWDPHRHKLKQTISTGHQGNIFSVKFMPESGDQTIVTGAADSKIRVHNVLMSEITHVCSCHMNRIKRIATAPTCPNLFWSASEDGTVMQFDLRAPHTCNTGTSACILVNLLNHLGQGAEAKCVAVCPTRPELLAVGANDPYVRLYDRRMIKTSTVAYPDNSIPRTSWERHFYLATRAGEGDVDENIPQGAVRYFVPGHLPPKGYEKNARVYRGMASTYLTFSADGNELLVNLGGEQIYLFDINQQRRPLRFDISEHNTKEEADVGTKTNGFSHSKPHLEHPVKEQLPTLVEKLKMCANEAFTGKLYTKAVNLYSEAVARLPDCALLYGNRAAALMKRGWEGDTYAAMRDCHVTLKLDPTHMKAQFRLARCLLELQRPREAAASLALFTALHPQHAQSHSCKALTKDVQKALDMLKLQEQRDEDKTSDEGEGGSDSNVIGISELEMVWRAEASDFELRFCGHCNTTTDIKEANFFGNEGQFIVAGSDDGSFFIWERCTGNIVRVLRGDDSIVNCLQPHPTTCLLATSGIDPVVRLWSPRPEEGESNDREVTDANLAATLNQKRMRADPFEVMLMNMGYRVDAGAAEGEEGGEASPGVSTINCRSS